MSDSHDASAAAVYALLALRQPRSLTELATAAQTRTFPSAAPPAPRRPFAAFTSHAPDRTPSVDVESSRRRDAADPFLVSLNAPELRTSTAA